MFRFLAHMLFVSILAPALVGSVYTLCEAEWHDTNLIIRVLGSFLGGFFLLAFIWFFTIPLGLGTYAICFVLRELDAKNRWLWVGGGTAIGLALGWFFTIWAKVPMSIFISSCTPIGAATGFVLNQIWCSDNGACIGREAGDR